MTDTITMLSAKECECSDQVFANNLSATAKAHSLQHFLIASTAWMEKFDKTPKDLQQYLVENDLEARLGVETNIAPGYKLYSKYTDSPKYQWIAITGPKSYIEEQCEGKDPADILEKLENAGTCIPVSMDKPPKLSNKDSLQAKIMDGTMEFHAKVVEYEDLLNEQLAVAQERTDVEPNAKLVGMGGNGKPIFAFYCDTDAGSMLASKVGFQIGHDKDGNKYTKYILLQ